MSGTLHFVYPRDPVRIDAPWAIGNELGDRLARARSVCFHDWASTAAIRPEPGDVLLGHPHPERGTVFRRALEVQGWRRRIILAPYNGDVRQVAFHDALIDRCDLFLAFTGSYWFDRLPLSPMRRWTPRMRRLDLGVNPVHFPALGRAFAPPGKRRFVYVGSTVRCKNTALLARLRAADRDADIWWIGAGNPERIAGVPGLGFHDFRTSAARALLAGFDFLITVGTADANPTTVVEAIAWGLVPVCSPSSGYEGAPGIVNIPTDDLAAALRVIRHLQWCAPGELEALRRVGRSQLARRYSWDVVHARVAEAVDADESPALRPRHAGEAVTMAVADLLSPYRHALWRSRLKRALVGGYPSMERLFRGRA